MCLLTSLSGFLPFISPHSSLPTCPTSDLLIRSRFYGKGPNLGFTFFFLFLIYPLICASYLCSCPPELHMDCILLVMILFFLFYPPLITPALSFILALQGEKTRAPFLFVVHILSSQRALSLCHCYTNPSRISD